jgi:hypothetical protein
VKAAVDVGLLLQGLKAEDTDAGQWVNVIGYVTGHRKLQSPSGLKTTVVEIQALVLWRARDLDIAAYEKSFVEHTVVETTG